MAWTAPRTWVAGEVVTAAIMNTHIRDQLNMIRLAPVTTPPASPADGDWCWLVDSTTNPTWQFLFRYNAGSSSAYKWECFGGTGIFATSGGTVASVGPTVTWSASGASISVPRSGDWEAEATGEWTSTGATGFEFGIGFNGAGPTEVIDGNIAGGGNWLPGSDEKVCAAVTSTIAVYHRTQGVGVTVTSGTNRLVIRPNRIS